jgi:hypothetical protein
MIAGAFCTDTFPLTSRKRKGFVHGTVKPLNAMARHTLGHPRMGLLDKILLRGGFFFSRPPLRGSPSTCGAWPDGIWTRLSAPPFPYKIQDVVGRSAFLIPDRGPLERVVGTSVKGKSTLRWMRVVAGVGLVLSSFWPSFPPDRRWPGAPPRGSDDRGSDRDRPGGPRSPFRYAHGLALPSVGNAAGCSVHSPGHKNRLARIPFSTYKRGVRLPLWPRHDADLAAGKVCEAVGQLFAKARATLTPEYYVQVDFDGFRRVIDRLGGVTVIRG